MKTNTNNGLGINLNTSIRRSVRIADLKQLGFTSENGVEWTLDDLDVKVYESNIDDMTNREWSEMYNRLVNGLDEI